MTRIRETTQAARSARRERAAGRRLLNACVQLQTASACRTDAINGLVFTSFRGVVAGHGTQLCPMLDHFEQLGQHFHLLDSLILVQRLPLTQRRSLRPFVAPDLVHLFGRKARTDVLRVALLSTGSSLPLPVPTGLRVRSRTFHDVPGSGLRRDRRILLRARQLSFQLRDPREQRWDRFLDQTSDFDFRVKSCHGLRDN